jgi:hypothetical protein
MKHKKDIILGVLVGVAAFVAMTIVIPYMEASELRAMADDVDDPITNTGLWSQMMKSDFAKKIPLTGKIDPNSKLEWSDIMDGITYKNIYLMMLKLDAVDPEENSLAEVGMSYGLTPQEAQDVIGGSLDPIWNIIPGSARDITHAEILYTASQFKRDYEEILEIAQLKAELGTSAYLSEIFSDGDVMNSGFDLVYDLNEIESLLFDTKTPIQGIDFGDDDGSGSDETPYQPAEDNEPEIASVYQALEVVEDEVVVEDEPLEDFDPEELVTYSDEDVCPEEEDPIEDAVLDYDEVVEEYFEENPPEETPEEVEAKEEEEKSFGEKLQAEPPADWTRKEKCDGILMFDSLGYGGKAQTETEDDEGMPLAEAEIYICLTKTVKWETYSSYVPAAPCFSCAFEKILAYFDKTLSNAMLPNKLTGNLMESSLCKKQLVSLNAIDINFILVWAPIQTPPNDEAIFGKNIWEEWDKFVQKTHPYLLETADGKTLGYSLLGEHENNMATSWVLQNRKGDETVAELIEEINTVQAQMEAETAAQVSEYKVTSQVEDFAIYSQQVMVEVGQMTEYFKVFNDMFKQIAEQKEYCAGIITKKSCDD